jgi:hypothetical protein
MSNVNICNHSERTNRGDYMILIGGAIRSRTGLNGFAGRGITALLSRL